MGLSQILESAFCYLQQSLFYYYFNMYIRSDRLLKGGENVKFIHTGDIHWGMSPDSDKPWSRERSRDIRDTFTAIIAKAAAAARPERGQLPVFHDPADTGYHHRRQSRPDPQKFRCFKLFLGFQRDVSGK